MRISLILARGIHVLKGRNRKAPRGARILCYHRVRDGAADYMSVPTDRFREEMQCLKADNCTIVSLEEIIQGKADAGSVAITFDDGWQDNYDNAFAVLKEFGFPATIFCIAGCVGQPDYLSLSQMNEMRRSGIAFGSHTVSHPKLNSLSGGDKQREIEGSKKILEEKLGVPVRYFCYPFGIYDEETVRAVQEAGYLGACSNRPGMNRYVSVNGVAVVEDPFLLQRTEMAGDDTLEIFRLKLAGAYDELHALLHWVRGRP